MNVKALQLWFIKYSSTTQRYEANKIWARWIITYLSFLPIKYTVSTYRYMFDFMPDVLPSMSGDLQIIIELMNKGCQYRHAVKHYRTFLNILNRDQNLNGRSFTTDDLNVYHQNYSIRKEYTKKDNIIIYNHHQESKKFNKRYSKTTDDLDNHHFIHSDQQNNLSSLKTSNRSLNLKVNPEIYNKLVKRYKYNFMVIPNIYLMVLNYYLLEGYSLQWSIPERTMKYISEEFNCQTELFASPLNVKLRNYYSLFHRDLYFGSKGNFFHAPDSDFQRGSFEVNAPFIEVIFTRALERILSLLNIAEKNDERLTFIFIIPDWQDCRPLNVLINSRYNMKWITLEKYKHVYYQSNNHEYIKVPFDTHVFVLSAVSNICHPSFESSLRYNWGGKGY